MLRSLNSIRRVASSVYMEKTPELSWEVFHVISVLLTEFISIEESCELSVSQMYVLAHIKQFGKEVGEGKRLVRRQDITTVLHDVFGHTAKKVTEDIQKLHEKGL